VQCLWNLARVEWFSPLEKLFMCSGELQSFPPTVCRTGGNEKRVNSKEKPINQRRSVIWVKDESLCAAPPRKLSTAKLGRAPPALYLIKKQKKKKNN